MGIRQKHEGQKVHRRGREGLQGACNTCATGCKRLMPRLWRQTDRKWDTRGLRLVAYSLLCVRADCMIRTTTQTQRVGGLLLPLRDSKRQLTPPSHPSRVFVLTWPDMAARRCRATACPGLAGLWSRRLASALELCRNRSPEAGPEGLKSSCSSRTR